MPGLIDCHVHVMPVGGQHPLPGGDAADADDGARGRPDARDARPRLHHGARHRRRRLGHQGRRSSRGYLPGPRLFIAGQAIGPTGGHSDARRRTDCGTRCHCCNAHGLHAWRRRRRRRGAQGRARADAPGRRPHQDHDVGRRRLALRSARQPAVLAWTKSRPRSRRRTPSAATSAPTPIRRRPSPAPAHWACAPSSTAT